MLPKTQNALLYGALDALILKTSARGPRHGYAIARSIEETSGDAVLVEEGSLYPALYRLERAAGSGDVRVRDGRPGYHRRAVDRGTRMARGSHRSSSGAAKQVSRRYHRTL